MHGLIIKQPWIELILCGQKTWEIRGSNTSRRGRIALIRGGSGLVVGSCDLISVHGPLSIEEIAASIDKHCAPLDQLDAITARYKKVFAWELADVTRLDPPVPYQHPSGAVIWVRLPDELL